MAISYTYVIQDAQTNEYLNSSNTWSADISSAQMFSTPLSAKEKMATLDAGYYILRYMGIVS